MAFDATTFEIDPLTLTTPRARLEYLRDFLRRLPRERFNMQREGDAFSDAEEGECGSPACIGGWARAIFRVLGGHSLLSVGVGLFDFADDGEALFFPMNEVMADGVTAWLATPSDAADVIDHYLRTGKVDWSVAHAKKETT